MNCKTCKWYFEQQKPDEKHPGGGQCRRYAPTVGFVALPKMSVEAGGLVPGIERCTAFPTVHADVWCGEYQSASETE